MSNIAIAVLGAVLIASCIIIMILWAWFSTRFLERLECIFSNSQAVVNNRRTFEAAGLPGKIIRAIVLGLLLVAPGLNVRNGHLNGADVCALPRQLKLCLFMLLFCHAVILLVLIALGLCIKFAVFH